MKKTTFVLLLCAASILSFAASFAFFQADTRTATVTKNDDGIFIFWECQPSDDFEILGTVSKTIGFTGSYGEMKGSMLKKAHKKYPDFDGIIIKPKSMGTDVGICIKFKD